MSTRKRTTSRERREKARLLRMDAKGPTPRISDPSLPAGRRREIDNVMKKARASPNSNAYWDKRLLEVEAKDPNRWRHSGFKSMYVDESSSPSPNRRSRSRSSMNRRLSRSPIGRRSFSPMSRRSPPSAAGRRISRSPIGRRLSRSPIGRRSSRSPIGRRSSRSPIGRRSSRSPPFRRSPGGRRSPPTVRRSIERRSPISRRSPPNARATKPGRPHSPPAPSGQKRRRSPSGSSMSSCSDESCSVCSQNSRRRSRSRSRSMSHPRSKAIPKTGPPVKPRQRPPSPHSPPRRIPRPATPPSRKPRVHVSDKPTDPRRQPPPPKPRNTTGDVINLLGIRPSAPVKKPVKKKDKINQSVMPIKVKKEHGKKRPGSPESSGSEDSSSSLAPIVATTRLTLSDRFGKMAQWSIDRERRDIENMRITKNSSGGDLKVMIEEDDFVYGGPPERYSHSPVPVGHFPDELLSSGPSGLAAWDDVRVRYQYYKDLGYLRDLSLDDYVKWEEWWYKYQDWLANERHYERWTSTHHRRRKHRVPASQRLN